MVKSKKRQEAPVRVFVRSDEHGNEIFEYTHLEAALAAIKRLYRACAEQPDGVSREIGIYFGDVPKICCPFCGKASNSGDTEGLFFCNDRQRQYEA